MREVDAVSPVERLAEYLSTVTYDDLPARVVQDAKLCVLDLLGCLIAGSNERAPRVLAGMAAPGRPPWVADVPVYGGTASTIDAALIGGIMGGTLELDDTHKLAGAHPGVATVPTALAMGGTVNADGKAFLTAVAVGYEAGARLGSPLQPKVFQRGLHTPAIGGCFSAAAAAASLLKLDGSRFKDAFAMCALAPVAPLGLCSGGGTAKDLYGGWPDLVGTYAAMAAAQGITGPGAAIEGDLGLWQVLSGEPREDAILGGLGEVWAVSSPCRKLHACCRMTHAPVDAVISLRETSGFDWTEVEEVVVTTHAVAFRMNKGEATDPVSARFSIPYTVARAILTGQPITLDDFTEDRISDPRIRQLMSRVRVAYDPELDVVYDLPPRGKGFRTAIVEISLTSGSRLRSRVDFPRGDSGNPMSAAELMFKFKSLSERVLPATRVERILDMVLTSESLASIRELVGELKIEPKA